MTYFFGVIAVIVVWVIFAYNRLVTMSNRVKEASADIETQQKRRFDLIPNIVEAVKGYAKHESGVFEKVTEARSKVMNAHDGKEQAEGENMLSQTLKSLFAVSENYPDLKANTNFLHLQQELTDTENKIQAARRFLNVNVRDFNISIQTFPTNLIAGMFGFTSIAFYDAPTETEEPVAVKF